MWRLRSTFVPTHLLWRTWGHTCQLLALRLKFDVPSTTAPLHNRYNLVDQPLYLKGLRYLATPRSFCSVASSDIAPYRRAFQDTAALTVSRKNRLILWYPPNIGLLVPRQSVRIRDVEPRVQAGFGYKWQEKGLISPWKDIEAQSVATGRTTSIMGASAMGTAIGFSTRSLIDASLSAS